MANELTLNIFHKIEKGSHKPGDVFLSQTIDVTNIGEASGIVDVGTSAETLSTGDITGGQEGVLLVQNLDATNFVKLGPDSSGLVDFAKIKAGEMFCIRVAPSTTVKIVADTSACKVWYRWLAD